MNSDYVTKLKKAAADLIDLVHSIRDWSETPVGEALDKLDDLLYKQPQHPSEEEVMRQYRWLKENSKRNK